MTNVLNFPPPAAPDDIEALADKLLNFALVSAEGDVDRAACAAERAMRALLNMLPSDG